MNASAGFVALALVSAAIVGVAANLPTPYQVSQSGSDFSLQFVRTGGFAGAHDVLTIEQGRAVYTSRFGPGFNVTLTQSELSSLRDALSANILSIPSTVVHPKSGMADFFSYGLNATVGGKTTTVSWVDGWASLEPLPQGLQPILQVLQGIIQAHS